MSSPAAITPQEGRTRTLRLLTFVLGAWNMASWAMYATSSWSTGGEKITLYMALQFAMLVIVQPLVSIPALYFAWKNERILTAFWLAAVPWIFYLLNVLAFGVSVAMYGF